MSDQRRFARADLAGDDDEALTLRQAIAKIAHRLLVAGALEIELRVGGELEGSPAEAVELFVHEPLIPSEIVAQANQRGGKGEVLGGEFAVEVIDRNRCPAHKPLGD